MKTIASPRVIRKVIRRDKKGNPKIARDLKAGLTAERIKAGVPRLCDGACIYPNKTIHEGSTYLKVFDFSEPSDGPFIRGRRIQTAKNYHPDCVPGKALYVVRLLVDMPWYATLVTGPDKEGHRRFTSQRAWLYWCDTHFPSMRKRFDATDGISPLQQVGTDYNWCKAEFKPVSRNP